MLREGISRMKLPTELEELGGFYYFLSRLFSHPPDASVVQDALALGWLSDKSEIGPLQVEFTRLFSIPGPEVIPSHQSIYTDTLKVEASLSDPADCDRTFTGGSFRGYLGGESCSNASQLYKSAGFVPPDPAPAMADHIGNEFAFMGYLCLMEAKSRKNGLGDEARAFKKLREVFWERFLGRWIKEFAEKLASSPVSEFYRLVGRQL
jgi:TorA maturation chaperone TorD